MRSHRKNKNTQQSGNFSLWNNQLPLEIKSKILSYLTPGFKFILFDSPDNTIKQAKSVSPYHLVSHEWKNLLIDIGKRQRVAEKIHHSIDFLEDLNGLHIVPAKGLITSHALGRSKTSHLKKTPFG